MSLDFLLKTRRVMLAISGPLNRPSASLTNAAAFSAVSPLQVPSCFIKTGQEPIGECTSLHEL